jgi:glycosyltransferase involved in cell wall biosynthesis
MSRLHPKKGVDVLLRAWRAQKNVERGVKSKEHGVREETVGRRLSEDTESLGPVLVIAGSDLIGYRKDVEQLVKKLGLGNSVVITGEVQGEMKDALLANAEVFVLPSYSENFGIVVAEAMAWGRPVIASTGTPWKEVADVGAGWWVAPEEDTLAKALAEALGHGREELDVMGAKGRALVSERYGWSVPANRLISSYKNILATAEGKLTRMNGFDKSRRLRRLD